MESKPISVTFDHYELRSATFEEFIQCLHNSFIKWGKKYSCQEDYVVQELKLLRTTFCLNHCRPLVLISKVLDDAIVGQCEIYIRDGVLTRHSHNHHHSSETVKVMSIASVFVPMQYRAQGYSKALFKGLKLIMKKYNFKVSTLYSGIGEEFYIKQGWYPSYHYVYTGTPLSFECNNMSLDYLYDLLNETASSHGWKNIESINSSNLVDVLEKRASCDAMAFNEKITYSFYIKPTADNVQWHWDKSIFTFEIFSNLDQDPLEYLIHGISLKHETDRSVSIIWQLDFLEKHLKVCTLVLAHKEDISFLLHLLCIIAGFYKLDKVVLPSPFSIPESQGLLNDESFSGYIPMDEIFCACIWDEVSTAKDASNVDSEGFWTFEVLKDVQWINNEFVFWV